MADTDKQDGKTKCLPNVPCLAAMRCGSYILNEPANEQETNGTIATTETAENNSLVEPVSPQKDKMANDELVINPVTGPTSRRNPVYRSALTKLLCGMYCLLLVVFGIVFAVANALTVEEREHKYYLEVFLIYLYAGSLTTLLYFQIGILRGVPIRTNYMDSNIKVILRRSTENLQKSPSPVRRNDSVEEGGEGGETGEVENKKEAMDHLSSASMSSHLVLPAPGEVAHVGEGINFYLRLGALAFSIGSVTLDGFHIASYFETDTTSTCESAIFTLVYVLHLIFTFVQTFFLFKNHKLVIDKHKAAVRFGLMHLLATNICVWLVTAIMETSEDYNQLNYIVMKNSNLTGTRTLKSCYEDMTLARTASPYLFPCTIIYSIIAAGVIYRMYRYVGVRVKQRWPSHTSLTSSVPQGAASMDCEKANKGLFSGLLVAVITLIAIATFFVFESRLSDPITAVQVFYVMELALLVLIGTCIIFGHLRLTQLKFQEHNLISLDSVLLIVALGGSYIYLCFMLISAVSMIQYQGIASILSLVCIIVSLLQSTLQAIFILDGLCRCSANDNQVERKPGRAMVTFLLVCNLALWVVSMFEIKKTMVVPFHQNFYGILSWNIMLHVCVPLFIFFRFHSAICLSKIWYQAYQKTKST
ncbi:hypothetical protein SNE40_016226 [Patella caerulea]|uniref:Otopetrin-2 n=1 Tax=Patella caerulea TaxID=87958 RepID=A0AAN8PCV6_PATCE